MDNKKEWKETLKSASQFFVKRNINTFVDDGKIYVDMGDCELELSDAEVRFRARLNDNKPINKTYIDNSRFMEFISEMATQLTEMNYGADTFVYSEDEPRFSEEAQDFFNETYDEFEMMANNIMGVYKHHDMIMHIYPNKKK